MGKGAPRRGGLVGPTLGAFGLVVLLVCAIFAFLVHAVTQGRDDARRARQTERALVLTARMTRLAIDLETRTRGRLLTGEDRFLAPYRQANAAIVPLERRLRPLLGTAAERRRYAILVRRLERYRRGFARRAARAPTTLSHAQTVALVASGKHAIDDLRGRFDDLRALELG